jgi:UDP-N-acetylmuramate dehydrogenase
MTLTGSQKNELVAIALDGVRFDEPMAHHTTIGIGGTSDALVRPRDTQMLKAVMNWAVEQDVPYLFLGKGSDTLIRDKGVRAIVIHPAEGFARIERAYENQDHVFVAAEAGVSTTALVHFTSEQGLSGIEGLAGIPGTVGGNVITNAGTSLGWIADVIEEITVVDRQLRELTIKRKALEFSYRRLKIPKSTAIVRTLLRLHPTDQSEIKQKIEASLEKRKNTQPVGHPTLGCVFKNPYKEGKKFPTAGELIEEAGLKGVRVGKARVSEVHANFIVNEGGSTARDVEVLMGLIKEHVKEKFGVLLEPEIHIIGET